MSEVCTDSGVGNPVSPGVVAHDIHSLILGQDLTGIAAFE